MPLEEDDDHLSDFIPDPDPGPFPHEIIDGLRRPASSRSFPRSLSPQMLEAAREAARQRDHWFRHLLRRWGPSGARDDKRVLRLAVRNGYLNFYLKGQCIAKVTAPRGELTCEIHVKYALKDAKAQRYARLRGGVLTYAASDLDEVQPLSTISTGARRPTIVRDQSEDYAGPAMLQSWIDRARMWETKEKRFVDGLIGSNATVVDVELGIPGSGRRIDMVSLAPREQGLTLSFWEVKHCKDRVRSRDGDSKVVRQMTDYRSFLQENSLGLGGAYRATSENLIELARLADIEENLSPLIAHAARQDPFVDPVPNLLVFGTEHELASPEWRRHRAKLDLHEADFRVTETSSENHDLLSAP